MGNEVLDQKIDGWAAEGLITAEQAEALKQREILQAPAPEPDAGRVSASEILVYIGSIVVFLAAALLLAMNWYDLGSAGRVLAVLVPTILMLALGWWLRKSGSARPMRGAQALLLAGSLLSALAFGVILDELALLRDEETLFLVSSLMATGVAGLIFARVPTVTQSIALHLCGSAALAAFFVWQDRFFDRGELFAQLLAALASCLVVGGLWLGHAAWQRTRGRHDLVRVSRLFGALTILAGTFAAAVSYYEPGVYYDLTWEKVFFLTLSFVASISFIAAAVVRQSLVYLYSGAAFLLLTITYVSVEYFADTVGMPVTLFVAGALLIAIGLGTERMRRRIRASS